MFNPPHMLQANTKNLLNMTNLYGRQPTLDQNSNCMNGKNMNLECCITFGTFDNIKLWDTWTMLDDNENIAKHIEKCSWFVVSFVSMLCHLVGIWCILLSPSTMHALCRALISATFVQFPPQCCFMHSELVGVDI